jgi:ectoine hydroxylase-related dioxygenase (phytanoyl-CoA dioxygenase family)
MVRKDIKTEINELGFAKYSEIISEKEVKYFISALSKLKIFSAVREKNGATYGVRNLLDLVPEIKELAESEQIKSLISQVLGENAKPVRAIFFDKTPDANWKVPWHQDLTIAVKEKRETSGFSAWTKKAGIQHVQPPIEILEKIIALRIHLDDSDETNGALKVVPKSHKNGRLSAEEIQNLLKANKTELCSIKRGKAFLMRPLLIHASSKGINPKHRRVIHVEYSAENLPNGLEFYGS